MRKTTKQQKYSETKTIDQKQKKLNPITKTKTKKTKSKPAKNFNRVSNIRRKTIKR
jgi:hypothetical protein